MHLIWLSVVIPPLAFIVFNFQQTRRLEIWSCCFWIGAAVTAAWVGIRWLNIDTQTSIFSPQAVIYALVTTNELPLFAMTIGSAINWGITRVVGPSPLTKNFVIADDAAAAESTRAEPHAN